MFDRIAWASGILAATVALPLAAAAQSQPPAPSQPGAVIGTPQPAGTAAAAPDPAQDPITEQTVRLLDSTGLIARQAEIKQSMILMDLQLEQANKIAELIEALGPDARIEIAPGVYRSFSDSAAALQQRIDLLQLQREYEDLLNRDDEPEIAETEPEEEEVVLNPARSDGTEFQNLLAAARRAAQQLAPAQPAPEQSPDPAPARVLALREISGFNGEFWAVVSYGDERIRVESGDTLPGGIAIDEVGPNFILFDRGGRKGRLILRN